MSTHGRTGIGRWLMGSVADRVLQVTDSPLLLVRGTSGDTTHTIAHFERVLLPLDGSALAESAFDTATWVASSLRVPLVITGVVRPVMAYYAVGQEGDESLMNSMEAQESEERSLQAYLQDKVQQALAQGVADVSSSMPRGFPAAELIDLAQSYPHSIMVMSTHGRSGISRWALGSVTDRVVRHTGQPVLVLRSTGT
jgi:nucleotide-binding universal stress UspA family protein